MLISAIESMVLKWNGNNWPPLLQFTIQIILHFHLQSPQLQHPLLPSQPMSNLFGWTFWTVLWSQGTNYLIKTCMPALALQLMTFITPRALAQRWMLGCCIHVWRNCGKSWTSQWRRIGSAKWQTSWSLWPIMYSLGNVNSVCMYCIKLTWAFSNQAVFQDNILLLLSSLIGAKDKGGDHKIGSAHFHLLFSFQDDQDWLKTGWYVFRLGLSMFSFSHYFLTSLALISHPRDVEIQYCMNCSTRSTSKPYYVPG